MLPFIHQVAFYLHVAIGSLALIIFWLPIFAKKGGKRHLKFGKIFVWGMTAVAISGLLMSSLVLFDPIAVKYSTSDISEDKIERVIKVSRIFAGFLLMLSVLVFTNVRQSVMVLKVKADRQLLKTPFHLGLIIFLGVLGIVMGIIGLLDGNILFEIFSVICILNSLGMIYYIFKPSIKNREWIKVHIGNILGAGVGAYTAFFSFGGRRFFQDIFSGELQIIPWILPAVIGLLATSFFNKKFKDRYKIV